MTTEVFLWIIIGSDRRPETNKELKEKLLGSDREGLGIGSGIVKRMNQIADLKLSILAPVKFRSPI